MHVYFASRGEVESALYFINEYFDDNILFGKFIELWTDEFIVTLRLKDCNGIGHTISKDIPPRNLPTACSHVHRAFFLELPDSAEVHDGQNQWKREDGYFPTKSRYPCECEGEYKGVYVPKRMVHRINI